MRLLLSLVLLTGTAAVAEEYPIHGMLSATALIEGPTPATAAHAAPADALARCAITIIHQQADGSFTSYIPDLEAFARGELAYDPVTIGRCVIAADGVETCTTLRQAPGLEDAMEFYDVPANATADGIDIAVYDTKDEATARANSPGYFKMFQCPIDVAKVTAALRTELSPLSQDEINSLRFPSPERLADPTTLAIAEAIRK